jgi:hypothetical protein
MTLDKFNEVVQGQIDRCLETLKTKGDEYASGDDRLEHFKTSAEEQEISPKQALWGMASKHITSLGKMCKSEQMMLTFAWDEKIGDAINYLLLLRALVEEEAGEDV